MSFYIHLKLQRQLCLDMVTDFIYQNRSLLLFYYVLFFSLLYACVAESQYKTLFRVFSMEMLFRFYLFQKIFLCGYFKDRKIQIFLLSTLYKVNNNNHICFSTLDIKHRRLKSKIATLGIFLAMEPLFRDISRMLN